MKLQCLALSWRQMVIVTEMIMITKKKTKQVRRKPILMFGIMLRTELRLLSRLVRAWLHYVLIKRKPIPKILSNLWANSNRSIFGLKLKLPQFLKAHGSWLLPMMLWVTMLKPMDFLLKVLWMGLVLTSKQRQLELKNWWMWSNPVKYQLFLRKCRSILNWLPPLLGKQMSRFLNGYSMLMG